MQQEKNQAMENKIIVSYYDAFNRKDWRAFLELLSPDVIHDINQNGVEIGKEAFSRFIDRMNRSYDEKVVDLCIFTSGKRASAEFMIEGTYLKTDEGLPEAQGQQYKIACGAFFEIKENKIARVTMYYNLKEWLKQVSGTP